jgi:hypothetical protein
MTSGKLVPHAGMRAVLCAALTVLFYSCSATQQRWSNSQHETINLAAGDLEAGGIAFLTPSTVTGQEEDRQPLAIDFVSEMQDKRPGLHIVGLPQTLSTISRAGLSAQYQRMLSGYHETGIFDPQALHSIGEAVGVRYLAELKLSRFTQGAKSRFGVFGLSLVQTQYTNIRIYLEIWDSRDGAIVWQGQNELTSAYDTPAETTVPFESVVRDCARDLIAGLP